MPRPDDTRPDPLSDLLGSELARRVQRAPDMARSAIDDRYLAPGLQDGYRTVLAATASSAWTAHKAVRPALDIGRAEWMVQAVARAQIGEHLVSAAALVSQELDLHHHLRCAAEPWLWDAACLARKLRSEPRT